MMSRPRDEISLPHGRAAGTGQSGRLATTPKAEHPLHVNVGIDFGTSATKVVFGGGKELRPSHVCVFEDNPPGYAPVCYPSTIRIVEGNVYFGAEAERRAGGCCLRSFKACMSCLPPDGRCRSCSNPLGGQRRAGLFDLGPSLPAPVAAEEVSAWYLAHVIAEIKGRIEDRFPTRSLRLTFQTAAPVKSCDDTAERLSFERALDLGRRMADEVHQGIPLQTIHEQYAAKRSVWEREHSGTPEPDLSVDVIPETHAALVAFLHSTQAEDGLYSIVDVGAGTSDISFFRYHRAHDGRKSISYYCSDVVRFGGDAIDHYIAECHPLREAWSSLDRSELMAMIRTAKQRDRDRLLPGGLELESEWIERAATTVAQNIYSAYCSLWSRAWEKEMKPSAWESYGLFLCGGGSRVGSAFPKAFEEVPRQAKPFVRRIIQRELVLPEFLEPDRPTSVELKRYWFLLPVAYGVGFHRPKIPECILPSDVSPLERDERAPLPGWQENDVYDNW